MCQACTHCLRTNIPRRFSMLKPSSPLLLNLWIGCYNFPIVTLKNDFWRLGLIKYCTFYFVGTDYSAFRFGGPSDATYSTLWTKDLIHWKWENVEVKYPGGIWICCLLICAEWTSNSFSEYLGFGWCNSWVQFYTSTYVVFGPISMT